MNKLIISISLFLLGTTSVLANEYPTDETVRFAMNCMAELGGQTDENLYTCACRFNAIKTAISYVDYEDGVTFERNKKMPGEKGGSIRDNARAEQFYNDVVKAREIADASCIKVRHVKLIEPYNK